MEFWLLVGFVIWALCVIFMLKVFAVGNPREKKVK